MSRLSLYIWLCIICRSTILTPRCHLPSTPSTVNSHQAAGEQHRHFCNLLKTRVLSLRKIEQHNKILTWQNKFYFSLIRNCTYAKSSCNHGKGPRLVSGAWKSEKIREGWSSQICQSFPQSTILFIYNDKLFVWRIVGVFSTKLIIRSKGFCEFESDLCGTEEF